MVSSVDRFLDNFQYNNALLLAEVLHNEHPTEESLRVLAEVSLCLQ